MREFKKKAIVVWETLPDLRAYNAEDGITLIESALADAYEKGLEDAAKTVDCGDGCGDYFADKIRKLKPSRKGAE